MNDIKFRTLWSINSASQTGARYLDAVSLNDLIGGGLRGQLAAYQLRQEGLVEAEIVIVSEDTDHGERTRERRDVGFQITPAGKRALSDRMNEETSQ